MCVYIYIDIGNILDLVLTSFRVIRVRPLFDYLGAIYYTCQIASLFVTSTIDQRRYRTDTRGLVRSLILFRSIVAAFSSSLFSISSTNIDMATYIRAQRIASVSLARSTRHQRLRVVVSEGSHKSVWFTKPIMAALIIYSSFDWLEQAKPKPVNFVTEHNRRLCVKAFNILGIRGWPLKRLTLSKRMYFDDCNPFIQSYAILCMLFRQGSGCWNNYASKTYSLHVITLSNNN